MIRTLVALTVVMPLALIGCSQESETAKPSPVELTYEAAGHYCQMTVLEHEGPKAQILFAGNPNPLWFTQVRDAVAFTRLPEEAKDYVAIYVNDMDKARSWADPGNDNWIEAEKAFFVIGSRMKGGMGAPEAIPYGTLEGAERLIAEHGGTVVRFAEIPDSYVLAPVTNDGPATETGLHMSEAER